MDEIKTLEQAVSTDQNRPCFKRNSETGLVEGINYVRRDDGRIDWRKMIRPEFIVFNSKYDKKLVELYGKPAAELNYGELITTGAEVDDRYILVLLQGFLELADLRGYITATSRIAHADQSICVCEASIDWIPNEEEPHGKTSYGTADATMENTNGWGYLAAMSGNRAFVRAVREGLRIPILAFDEIAKKDMAIPESTSQPQSTGKLHTDTLKSAAEKYIDDLGKPSPLTFDQIKSAAMTKYRDKMEGDPSVWNRWEDVPPKDALTLIKLIRTKDRKK